MDSNFNGIFIHFLWDHMMSLCSVTGVLKAWGWSDGNRIVPNMKDVPVLCLAFMKFCNEIVMKSVNFVV